MIISIDVGRAFDKTQHPCMIKIFQKVDIERRYLNIIRAIYDKTKLNSYTVMKNGKNFLEDQGQDKDAHSHHFYSR